MMWRCTKLYTIVWSTSGTSWGWGAFAAASRWTLLLECYWIGIVVCPGGRRTLVRRGRLSEDDVCKVMVERRCMWCWWSPVCLSHCDALKMYQYDLHGDVWNGVVYMKYRMVWSTWSMEWYGLHEVWNGMVFFEVTCFDCGLTASTMIMVQCRHWLRRLCDGAMYLTHGMTWWR